MSAAPALDFSFEFFPPRTPQGSDKLRATWQQLAQLKPRFFSVTFGAGGSTQERTFDTVREIKQETGINVAPHLSCIGSTKDNIRQILSNYQAQGIRHIVALRGDMPSGMREAGEFRQAVPGRPHRVARQRRACRGAFERDRDVSLPVRNQAASVVLDGHHHRGGEGQPRAHGRGFDRERQPRGGARAGGFRTRGGRREEQEERRPSPCDHVTTAPARAPGDPLFGPGHTRTA